jgi:spore photoproduct lyase
MKPEFKTIFYEESIDEKEQYQEAAREILERFPNAKVKRVESHNKIPELIEIDPAEWIASKKDYLVIGIKKELRHQPNNQSADFIAASHTTGCIASCQYCYVARNTGGSNVARVYANIDNIIASIDRHQKKLGSKNSPNQQDSSLWVYDIGSNNDNSLDATYSDNPLKMIKAFSEMENAKASFATKFVNEDAWLSVDPKGKTRIRHSLMPQEIARYVDIRTSPISERIRSMNNLVNAGYEVHANFSPVIAYGGDQWAKNWKKLWEEMNDVLHNKVKEQLKCEVIFLTHSQKLHELNLNWNPKGEEFLVGQIKQRKKYNKPDVLVYNYQEKKKLVSEFSEALNKNLPYCPIRYIF